MEIIFLRSKLYGDGERGIQNFAFIDLPDGTTRTIQHIPQGIASTPVEIRPIIYSAGTEIPDVSYRFTILDHRGLVAVVNGQSIVGNAFNSANIDKRQVVSETLQLNAQEGQIERQVTRTVLVERDGGGAAPTQVVITVQPNQDVNAPGVGVTS